MLPIVIAPVLKKTVIIDVFEAHAVIPGSVIFICVVYEPQGCAVQDIPVPVPGQDKFGGLRQEGHPA